MIDTSSQRAYTSQGVFAPIRDRYQIMRNVVADATGRILLFIPFLVTLPTLQYPYSDYQRGGLWTFQVILAMFVATPLGDILVGDRKGNVRTTARRWANTAAEYGVLMKLWVVLLLITQLWAMSLIVGGSLGMVEVAGLTVTMGLVGGVIGIPVGHELMHRPSKLDRAFAEIRMCAVSYPHYCIAHVYGHHRDVATPLDPATGKYGENFYRFLLRCLRGELATAWDIECKRLAKLKLPTLHYRNRMLRYGVEMLAVYFIILILFGLPGLIFFIAQSAVAIFPLEVINYVQHYGLRRRETAPGVYERVRPHHSWNTAARLSNASLVNLGGHSDHHMVAGRQAQVLWHFDDSDAPLLPGGLPVMFVAALVPPIWFRIMNPRVQAEREKIATGRRDKPTEMAPYSGDVDADFNRLGGMIATGRIVPKSIRMSGELRRAIVVDKVDQYGGWLMLGLLVGFFLATVHSGLVAAYAFLVGGALGMLTLKEICNRWVSSESVLRWAASQPWNWRRLWQESESELAAGGNMPICRSPLGDWRSYVNIAALADERAMSTVTANVAVPTTETCR